MRTMLSGHHIRALAALGSLVMLQACGMENVEIPADLVGPAGQGINVKLAANPDWVIADNTSQSQVTATVWGPDGRPIGGRAIIFEITDSTGVQAGIGELSTTTGQTIASGMSATAVTNGSGVATVVFSAPARTDILAATNVLVRARAVGDDYSGARWGTVGVQVIPAEPRLFPPNPGNAPPTCTFTMEPSRGPTTDGSFPPGFQILFQSTSSDTPPGRIVRYEWDFGDGTGDLKSDVNHAYNTVGTYTVRHQVTDNNGAQCEAAATRTIVVK